MDNLGLNVFNPQPSSDGSGGSGGNANVDYSRPAMSITVGGAGPNTTFTGTIQDALDKILYPYLAPTFASFSLSGVHAGNLMEIGETLASPAIFNWTFSNQSNVTANSISIRDITGNNVLGTAIGISGPASLTITSITPSAAYSRVYRIEGVSSHGSHFYASLTLNWIAKSFFGTIPSEGLTNLQNIKAYGDLAAIAGINIFNGGSLQSNLSTNNNFNCTGGKYVFFLFPTSLGTPSFTSGGFGTSLQGFVKSGFGNAYNIGIDYKLYISGLQTGPVTFISA